MVHWAFVAFMIAAGTLIAFQSPINAALSRSVGVHEAALVSFSVGMLVSLAIVAVTGTGHLGAVVRVPRWQLLGGVCGALYVTSIIVAVPRIGVTTMLVAALIGQVGAALVIDRNGWFGLPVRPIEAHRVAGLVLLFAALWLIGRR